MEMTLEQYIANPMGKNNAVLNASTREIMRLTYQKKFDNILLRENGKINYTLFEDKKDNTYWIYIKIPSEVVKNFYYDVVLKFYANSKTSLGEDLLKWNVKFFSNDPAFVYTYAHVFRENDLFIKELSSKMSKEALKKAPKEKNPGNNIGYVKSLFFAYLVIKNKSLNKLSRFKAESVPLNGKYLLSNIMEAGEKIALRQEEGSKISTRKKVDVSTKAGKVLSKYSTINADQSRVRVKTTKSIGSIKNSSGVKAVKNTKRK